MLGVERIAQLALPPLPPEANPGATVQRTPDARVRDMARELESTFLSMLLKEMRQTLEGEGLFPGDTGDVQGGLFDLFLGKHLADSGGVGLAAAVQRQMQPVTPTDAHHRPTGRLAAPAPPG
jgi:flagellar protein FlgJ